MPIMAGPDRGRGADRAERACQFTIRSPAVCPLAGDTGRLFLVGVARQ